MTKIRELSLAFAEAHPDDAARVLEQLPAAEAAAFLSLLPARLGAPVLRHMLPTAAARCLEQVDLDTAAGLVRDLDTQTGTGMLRYVEPTRREQLIGQLPTAAALAFRLLLAYPEDTVGAWVNARALAMAPDTPASEALERLRQSTEPHTGLYVVDPDHKLLGQLTLGDLFRAGRGLRVHQVMKPVRHHLSARASLAAARDHDGWNECSVLPVVERQGRFVGVLEATTLRRAGEVLRVPAPATSARHAAPLLARHTWQVFASLLQAAIALLPTPSASEGHRES